MAQAQQTREEATFAVTRPAGPPGPVVFASPHSGDLYPADMGAAPDLSPDSLHSAGDRLVDRLVAGGPARGAALIVGRVGRSYLDLNRAADELDPALIDGVGAEGATARTRAGYGVVPRLSGDGRPLYDRRLGLAEVEARLAAVHRPYHRALAGLMDAARAAAGRAVLIDWHSMPARAAGGPGGVDVVLGDRHGAACDPRLTRRLRRLFEGEGLTVALNRPYAGGHATRTWGRPDDGFHAVQVELNRALYLDRAERAPGPGWGRCVGLVERVIAPLCAEAADLTRGA